LQEISKAKTDEEAIRSYEKLAELYLAANDMEQSLGTYMKVVDKYPKHIMAPTCLSYAISLLEQSDKDKYASRINILVDRLKKSYPESPEAKKYLAETISVLK
jgi:predicted Zn-dependent protease